MAKAIPEGYHTITPFLVAEDATGLIKFMKKAFKGEITYMMQSDDGIVRHATVRIGDSIVMLSSATEMYKPTTAMLHLYVDDMDTVYDQAVKAGGESVREPRNEFYGDRSSCVKDKWGNQWFISTHIEDVSDEEMKVREEAFRKEMA